MKTFDINVDRSPEWGRYVLDNAAPQTPARFAALAELYDATTIRHLQRIGVHHGWQCWEIGAGPGSLTEEFDSVSQLPAPDRYPWEMTLKSTAALRTVMIDRGVNLGFGRSLAGHLRARG